MRPLASPRNDEKVKKAGDSNSVPSAKRDFSEESYNDHEV